MNITCISQAFIHTLKTSTGFFLVMAETSESESLPWEQGIHSSKMPDARFIRSCSQA